MKKYIYLILSGILFVTLWGCISEFNADIPDGNTDILVVDGTIISNSWCNFHLGKTISLNETPKESKIDATIVVIGENGYKSKSAEYVSDNMYQVFVDDLDNDTKYYLQVEYDGDIYQSQPEYPIYTPPIDELTWKQPSQERYINFYLSTENNQYSPTYYLWQVEEDWELKARYSTELYYDYSEKEFYFGPDSAYYCWQSVRNNPIQILSTKDLTESRLTNLHIHEVFAGIRFEELYCISVSQRALSQSEFQYYENKKKLNEEMGGLFSPQPSDITGNITCTSDSEKRALGFIGVNQGSDIKRVFLERDDIISYYMDQSECELLSADSVYNYMIENNVTTFWQFYERGYRPVAKADLKYPQYANWTTIPCIDCTKNGGNKNRPSWWPDNGHY